MSTQPKPFGNGSAPNQAAIDRMIAQKKKEIEERARMLAGHGTTASGSNAPQPQTTSALGINQPEIMRRIQEAKQRVLSGLASTANAAPQIPTAPEPRVTGGVGAPLHPLLQMDASGQLAVRPSQAGAFIPKPSFATVKANQRAAEVTVAKPTTLPEAPVEDISKNPYFDASLGSETGPKTRTSRNLRFITPGRFVAQANQMRKEAQLDKLKQDIAERSRKAGMEMELDAALDKQIRRAAPPTVEWWDAAFLCNQSYDDLDDPKSVQKKIDEVCLDLVQHPVPIPPPFGTHAPAPRPLMLTKKEQKKLRRQRRAEEQKEKQDKIRLGLLPPEEPKVRLSNLMRVLGQEAVLDPTKIEAKVRKQVEERRIAHDKRNLTSKLTAEEIRAKKIRKMTEDAAKVVRVAIYRINDLSHKQKRFKVDKNAQQLHLTGTALIGPQFSLVVVEGGPKGIRMYNKLMLRRIDWTEEELETEEHDEGEGNHSSAHPPKGPNSCHLVWEGEVKERGFHGFRFKQCESDRSAREWLARANAEHYWDYAKNFAPVEGAHNNLLA